jgi:UDP-N-acetylmuramyl pentapeptide phosphotransferase/UDP-N-acetylglucosamine-1-phosphate transferase
MPGPGFALTHNANLAWWVSAVVAIALVLTQRLHGRYSLDAQNGIQKFHAQPTPRIGGVAIMSGLVLEWLWASAELRTLLTPLLLCGAPAFAAGLVEDLTKRVSVRVRLLATMGSGVAAAVYTGVALQHTGLPLLDSALQWWPLALLVTAIAVGGVANAVNIVDGFNGLSSGMALIAFLAYGAMAAAQGDAVLAALCWAMATAVAGFFLVNWPWGKLFLGDGGAYFTGFALAWVAILLMHRHPEISPFAVLAVCVHPVTEVLFSMYRRRVKRMSPGDPDRLHLHSLVMRRYATRWFSPAFRNSATGLMVALLTVPAAWVGYALRESHVAAGVACVLLMMAYVALYARIVRHRWAWMGTLPTSTALITGEQASGAKRP